MSGTARPKADSSSNGDVSPTPEAPPSYPLRLHSASLGRLSGDGTRERPKSLLLGTNCRCRRLVGQIVSCATSRLLTVLTETIDTPPLTGRPVISCSASVIGLRCLLSASGWIGFCMSRRSRERRAERVSRTRRSERVNSVGAGVNTELVAPPSTPPPIVAAWLAWAFDGPSTKVAVRESPADLGCDGAALAMASTRADQSHCGAGRLRVWQLRLRRRTISSHSRKAPVAWICATT
jgi:hypothetical protein